MVTFKKGRNCSLFIFTSLIIIAGSYGCRQPVVKSSFIVGLNAYSGSADSLTMQLNIIAPLQKEISKIEGIQKISSQSKKGVGSITITFKGAMNEATTMVRVQNSASLVSAKLPKGVEVVLFKVKKEHSALRK